MIAIDISELGMLNTDVASCLADMASCKTQIGGMLFILPENTSELSNENVKAFEAVQDSLANQSVP